MYRLVTVHIVTDRQTVWC